MNDKTEEKRYFKRIPFDTNVKIIGPGNSWESTLIDVALKGALVDQPDDWQGQVGDNFKLELSLGNDEIIIYMDTTVAHIQDNHIGFKCNNIDIDSIAHLKRLMELNLGDAELVNRELSLLGQ